MTTLGGFSKRMTVLSLAVGENADKIVRKVALVVDRDIVLATPVDTGRARSSWVVGVVRPNRSTPGNFPKGKNQSTKAQATQFALDKANEVIRARKKGQSIIISNNLKYIGKLNEGTSAQAPKMFVQKAILNGIRAIKTVKILE